MEVISSHFSLLYDILLVYGDIILVSFYCKEGTFLNSATRECDNCPVGTYQNMRDMYSCKDCPEKYKYSNETGLTACTCPEG